jgi:hypothetical protein
VYSLRLDAKELSGNRLEVLKEATLGIVRVPVLGNAKADPFASWS